MMNQDSIYDNSLKINANSSFSSYNIVRRMIYFTEVYNKLTYITGDEPSTQTFIIVNLFKSV